MMMTTTTTMIIIIILLIILIQNKNKTPKTLTHVTLPRPQKKVNKQLKTINK